MDDEIAIYRELYNKATIEKFLEERLAHHNRIFDIEVKTLPPEPDPYQITKYDGRTVRAVKRFYVEMRELRRAFVKYWKETGEQLLAKTIEVLTFSAMAIFFSHAIAYFGFTVWTNHRCWSWYEWRSAPYYVWVPIGVAVVLGLVATIAAVIVTIWLAGYALYYIGLDLALKMPCRIARLIDRYGPQSDKTTWLDDFDI